MLYMLLDQQHNSQGGIYLYVKLSFFVLFYILRPCQLCVFQCFVKNRNTCNQIIKYITTSCHSIHFMSRSVFQS